MKNNKMKKIQLKETELTRLIHKVINEEGPIYGPNIGICLCPPPWTPCGCLGQAMDMGIAPEDMDPNDFRGNEDTGRGRGRGEFNEEDEEDDSPNISLLADLLKIQALDDSGGMVRPTDMSRIRARALSESDLRRIVNRVINEDRQLLNEDKRCTEQWDDCMDWADGLGWHAQQICNDEWCECEGDSEPCEGMVGPSGPRTTKGGKPTRDDMSRIRARALSESDLRRLVKRVINEEKVGGKDCCDDWAECCSDDDCREGDSCTDDCTCLMWGGGQWNPPTGSGPMSAGKYANVAPNISNKNNIDLKAKPSSGGNFRMGESDWRVDRSSEEKIPTSSEKPEPKIYLSASTADNDALIVDDEDITESDLRRLVKRVINEVSAPGIICSVRSCTGSMTYGSACLPNTVQIGDVYQFNHRRWFVRDLGGTCGNAYGQLTDPSQCPNCCAPSHWQQFQQNFGGACTTNQTGNACTGGSTPTGGCDTTAWSGYNTWVSNWSNGGPFNSQNPKQPCNHICKQINTWTTKIPNAGTTQANQLNCKVDFGNMQSQVHGCNC